MFNDPGHLHNNNQKQVHNNIYCERIHEMICKVYLLTAHKAQYNANFESSVPTLLRRNETFVQTMR